MYVKIGKTVAELTSSGSAISSVNGVQVNTASGLVLSFSAGLVLSFVLSVTLYRSTVHIRKIHPFAIWWLLV
jgi:hypothetical protein